MASYKDLNELILRAVSWEKQLKDLYEVAELGLKDTESKRIASLLKENLNKKLDVLERIDVGKHGSSEWLKIAPDYREADIVPKKAITRDSTPQEIFDQLLNFEQRMRDFYSKILDSLHTTSQKDLLSSLVTFKEEQINELQRFIKQYKPGK